MLCHSMRTFDIRLMARFERLYYFRHRPKVVSREYPLTRLSLCSIVRDIQRMHVAIHCKTLLSPADFSI